MKYPNRITRFDAGISSESRLANNATFSFVKGDVSENPNEVRPTTKFAKVIDQTELNIKAVGADISGDILGVGYAASNWWTTKATKRYYIESTAWTLPITMFNLSFMPDEFWDEVEADQSNFHVASTGHNALEHIISSDFDIPTKTGYVIVPATSFYIYLVDGIGRLTTNFNGVTGGILGSAGGFTHYVDLDGQLIDRAGTASDPSSTVTYGEGIFGQGLQSAESFDDGGYLSGDDVTILVYFRAQPGATGATLYNGDYNVTLTLNGSGQLVFYVDGTSSNINYTFGSGLADGNWHSVAIFADAGDQRYYIDGVQVATTSTNYGNFDNSTNNDLLIGGSADVEISQLLVDNSDNQYPLQWVKSYDSLRTNRQLHTVSVQQLDETEIIYQGVQLYQLDTTTNTWLDVVGAEIIKNVSSTYSPGYGPVFEEGNYFYFPVVASGALYYMAQWDKINDDLDEQFELMFPSTYPVKAVYIPAGQIGSTVLVSDRSAFDKYDGATLTDSAFTAGGSITDFIPYGPYLAYSFVTRGQSFVAIWDQVNNQASSLYDVGRGEVRIVENFQGRLVAVVDSFINDDDQPYRSLDVREASTIAGSSTITQINVPQDTTTYTASYATSTLTFTSSVCGFKGRTRNGVVFWANLTINGQNRRGLWHLAENVTTNVVGLTYYSDLPAEPVDIFNVENKIYVLDVDGNLWSDNGEQDTVEVATQFISSNTTEQSHFHGFTVGTHQLTEGQSVTGYYRERDDADWIEITTYTSGEVHNFPITTDFATEMKFRAVGSGGVVISGIDVLGDSTINNV